jgi:S-adenosylmethionine:tRNA ribosyltransferase-isomerase
MVLDRGSGAITHRVFSDIVELIGPDDLLVVNETRVFPARLRGRRSGGGAAEVLLLHPTDEAGLMWRALVRPGAKLKPGRRVEIANDFHVRVLDSEAGGERLVQLETDSSPLQAIERHGEVPLPPYLRRASTDADRERYQTVYARESGSVAAPTAGLHFSEALMKEIRARGVRVSPLVLHVGVGTFRPVEFDDPDSHAMHAEWYRVPEWTATEIDRTRDAGGAVWAVGTTTVRTLESVAIRDRRVQPGEGWTDIFIRPPYEFKVVDRLITNFHLPRSTLLMLVAAFAGYDRTMAAYQAAIDGGYRFYSYGDAMAIV